MQHPHTELMKQYAEDAMETDKPWERWEYSYEGEMWSEMKWNLSMDSNVKYRRKPEPEEVLPPVGTPVWVRDSNKDHWVIGMFVKKNNGEGMPYIVQFSRPEDTEYYKYMTTENPYKPVV